MSFIADSAPDVLNIALRPFAGNVSSEGALQFPTLVAFWSTCLQRSTAEFFTCLVLGCMCAIVATVISIRHIAALRGC